MGELLQIAARGTRRRCVRRLPALPGRQAGSTCCRSPGRLAPPREGLREAVADFTEAIGRRPGTIAENAYKLRAGCYRGIGMDEEAERDLREYEALGKGSGIPFR